VTTAFFDEKETAKINEGAGRYRELRDRADVVLNSRDRNLEQVDHVHKRLTETQTALQKKFDIYIYRFSSHPGKITKTPRGD
jgi:uncharacterized coiled-coil DUF342 family protein